MATNTKPSIPAVATHPGSILKKELKARGIKQKDLAQAMGIPASNLSELINGKRNITPALAMKLEQTLGTPFQNWMNLQSRYHYAKLHTQAKPSAPIRSLPLVSSKRIESRACASH